MNVRSVLFALGGRKFLAFLSVAIPAGLGWGFGKIEPYDAVLAIAMAAIAYMASNVAGDAVDAKAQTSQVDWASLDAVLTEKMKGETK